MVTATHQTDWAALEQQFIDNTSIPSARTWLRVVRGWSSNRINSGHTQKKIRYWGIKRAENQQQFYEYCKEICQEEVRQLIPSLYLAKAEILKSLVSDIPNMETKDKVSLLKVIKTELKEPLQVRVDNNIEGEQLLKSKIETLLQA